jgi:hypothetical protein
MPVPARLSKLLYERLGEQVANELVEWFNQVDATYRADPPHLNELARAHTEPLLRSEVDIARFKAKLEQRAVELNARIERGAAEANARMGLWLRP